MGINRRRGKGFCRFSFQTFSSSYIKMSTADEAVTVEEAGGGLPPSKWDQGLFEQVVRRHQFAKE
ncbi:hypothetical protein Hanom_Chr14g01301591 [Helianthus anomalus]